MKKGDYSCMCGSDKCYTCARRLIRQKWEKKRLKANNPWWKSKTYARRVAETS